MAAFQRFLSYLYEYQGNEKKENTGFAKTEVRGDTQRIQIVLNHSAGPRQLQVAVFCRKEGRCPATVIGQMHTGADGGQFQYQNRGNNLSEGGIAFSEICGLVLFEKELPGHAFATVWDDEPFALSMLKQESEETAAEATAEAETPSAERKTEEAAENKLIKLIKNYNAGETAPEQEPEPELEPEAEPETASEKLSSQCISEEKEPFWDHLCSSFPKIEPLLGKDVECLKMMPADLGKLPKQYWVLGNNGFLMYGFVKHRYLALARLSEDRFELWVPGTFGKNEKRMAEMFGFLKFRSTKAVNASAGDFGYWCVPIEIPA